MQSQNRAQKLLAYLGDLAVNGSSIKGQSGEPGLKDEIVVPKFVNRESPEGPPLDTTFPCEVGWRNIIVEKGPEAFAKAVERVYTPGKSHIHRSETKQGTNFYSR